MEYWYSIPDEQHVGFWLTYTLGTDVVFADDEEAYAAFLADDMNDTFYVLEVDGGLADHNLAAFGRGSEVIAEWEVLVDGQTY